MNDHDSPTSQVGSVQQVAAFRALLAVTRAVHSSLDLRCTLDAVARGVAEASGFAVAAVNMIQPDGTYRVVAVEGGPQIREALLDAQETAEQWQVLIAESRDWGALRFIHHDDAASLDDCGFTWVPELAVSDDPDAWHPLDCLFAPMISHDGTLIGCLSVDLPRNGRLPDAHQQEMLALFAGHAGIAIEHALMYDELHRSREKLRHAASHDALTGLSNRTVLSEGGPAMAARAGQQIAVVVVDLDGFKHVNDSAGHQAGDDLLTALSLRMQNCVRAGDILARTGGDEFILIVTAPDLTARVPQLINQLTTRLTEPVQLRGGTTFQIGASIGVATATTPTDLDTLIAAADADMYHTKRARHRPDGAVASV